MLLVEIYIDPSSKTLLLLFYYRSLSSVDMLNIYVFFFHIVVCVIGESIAQC